MTFTAIYLLRHAISAARDTSFKRAHSRKRAVFAVNINDHASFHEAPHGHHEAHELAKGTTMMAKRY